MAIKNLLILPPLPMLKIPLFSALLCFSLSLFAQTNISGIVNSYYQVTDIIPAKGCIVLNTTAGLSLNDRIMIIQMKGAGIDVSSSSSSSFGDTTSLNNAGNYEMGTICYIRSDSVFLVYLLSNQYTLSASVQLVRVPQYYSATVTDTLKAAPWDGATGTGGVLAIYVEQDLVLNAPVSADSAGYRGGAYKLSSSTCTNIPGATAYAYNPTSGTQNGAYKGEGVADIASVSQQGGRGAPANGGGGGNNHNNGGGGGANLGAGGDGGGNSSSTGCTLSIPGKGGKALSNYGGRKIFMGGGGGAGHTNNGPASGKGGGHGGGIVFIRTNNLIGNDKKISANGQTGGTAASDGACGGGAGGTIVISANNYSGIVTIEANGGEGGQEDDGLNLNRCYGSGGGGGGGAIYHSGSIPSLPDTTRANGGGAGPEINHHSSCNTAVASAPGGAGLIFSNYTYTSSMVLNNTACSLPLAAELTLFNAGYVAGQTRLNWNISQPDLINYFIIEKSRDGGTWSVINSVTALAGITGYEAIDLSPLPGTFYYRIKVIRKNNAVFYSSTRLVFIADKKELVNIYPNPASHKIFITGIESACELSLSDLSGKIIYRQKLPAGSREINFPSLPAGIYIIKIGEIVKKISIYQ